MPSVSIAAMVCAVSGRIPVWPVARVDNRSSIIARTTSRSTSGAVAGGVRAHQRLLELRSQLGAMCFVG